jgi:phosphoglycolate phosphatase-like HAD superfamily hydrolase
MKPRVTFMDCDGVIFDVNAAKLRAFDQAVSEFPRAARDRLMAHHAQAGGVSRYDRFRWFFTEVVEVDDVNAAVEKAVERFGAITRRAYDDLKPRPEALRFAERMGGAESVHVVSGSDQNELRAIFDDHGITDRFASVLGSPKRKAEHFEEVLAARGVAPSEAVMVGDGAGDFRAAKKVGVRFVFLGEMTTWTDWRDAIDDSVLVAHTWSDLQKSSLTDLS